MGAKAVRTEKGWIFYGKPEEAASQVDGGGTGGKEEPRGRESLRGGAEDWARE